MPGTKIGGVHAGITNKKKYGPDFYRVIGAMGGAVKGTRGGFASLEVGEDGLTGVERARVVGRKGGLVSRRGAWTAEERAHHVAKRPHLWQRILKGA